MSFITNNSISLITIVFFILFTFVGFLRKPLTLVTFFFVMRNVAITVFSMDGVIPLVVGGVATLVSAILMLKSRKFASLLFAFTITYLAFTQLATVVDAVMHYAKQKDIAFLSKVLNGELVGSLSYNVLKLAASGVVGIICFIKSQRMVEFIAGLFGGFMIVTYLLDAVGDSTGTFPLTTFYKDIFGTLDKFIAKYAEIFNSSLSSNDAYLNIVIALVVSIIISIIVSVVKKHKYEFLQETNC